MSQKALLTQGEIAAFKDATQQLASNLNTHINHSLSKAHGIQLITGYTDSDGNNLTTYQNSHGDVVGTYFVRFAINGVLYYAPGISTVLAGQAASTGSLDTNPDITTVLGNPGAASLVTEYASIEIQQTVNVNSLLLEHSRTNHDLVHSYGGVMSVVPKTTIDSAGYTVGRYVIKFVVNGVEYEIPCDTRLGGPPQPMRGSSLLSNVAAKHNSSRMGRDDEQFAVFTFTAPTGGTRPYTMKYQINQKADGSGVWNDMSDATPGWHEALTDQDVFYDISVANTLSLQATEGSDDNTLQCTIRALLTNAAGSYSTNYGRFYANDEDGCGFVSGPGTNGETFYEAIPGSPPVV